MKDRISTEILPNGALRYAEYDGAGNFVQYRYFLPADVPTEEGAAWSKGNVLPDEVAAAFGLTGDPQVKDVFSKTADELNAIKYVKLLESTVGTAASSVTLDLSSLDTTIYKKIVVLFSVKGSTTTSFTATINGLVSGYYNTQNYFGSISSAESTAIGYAQMGSASFTNAQLELIYDGNNTTAEQSVFGELSFAARAGAYYYASHVAGGINTTLSAGISTISLKASSGTISVGSKFTVYGVKA